MTRDTTLRDSGHGAFNDCSNLNELILNEGLQKIGNGAFFDRKSLENLKVPSTLFDIGTNKFNICRNLRDVTFNDGLQKIGTSAFNCTALRASQYHLL